MSTTETRRSLAQAMEEAEAFRDLFVGCYQWWEIAGSIRRRKESVGDVEHVVLPAFGDVPVKDDLSLFPSIQRVNLMWHRLDESLGQGMEKHIYGHNADGTPKHKWGSKYRGVEWYGFNNEIFCADGENWGSVLAIRTGPADFSRELVTGLRRHHRRNKDGYVWACDVCCGCRDCSSWPDLQIETDRCDGTKLIPRVRLSVGTEEEFFSLAGIPYRIPEDRH